LNVDGVVRIGQLKAMGVTASDLKMDIKARDGVLDINPMSAKLYQGTVIGSLSVNVQGIPQISLIQNLSHVDVASLGKAVANFGMLEGKGNVGVNLTLQGSTVSQLKRAMNGGFSLSLADGAIKGINIAKKIRETKSLLGAASQAISDNQDEKTDFSELKATFKVTHGIAHNDDLLMKSPLLRLTGNGDINLGEASMNYLAKATLAKTLEGQGGRDNVGGLTVPVRISGPFVELKYALDFKSMLGENAKRNVDAAKAALQQQADAEKKSLQQHVEVKKDALKSQLQDKLKSGLNGLFQ
jgi:AsmA protein